MHRKVKQTQYDIFIGTICTGACHAQRKRLAFTMLDEVVSQAPLQWSPSLAETSCDDGPTYNDMHILKRIQLRFQFELLN
jgi:hypothetical protein